MKNLLIKEIKLAASPLSFIFLAASALALVPGYPILLAPFFVCLGIFYSFQNAREANDVIYSMLLPIAKRDYVRAKYAFTLTIEGISFVLISAVTAVRMTLLADAGAYAENPLMNATPVYLAFVLLMFASFNVFFLSGFFRTGWKIGVPFVVFCAVGALIVFAGEALRHFPGLEYLHSQRIENAPLQFAALGAGIVLFFAASFISMKVSEGRFEKIDL